MITFAVLLTLSVIGAMSLLAWLRDGGTIIGFARWLADRETRDGIGRFVDTRDALQRATKRGRDGR